MSNQLISEIVRDSYGKLISRLVVRGIPISDAEDALGTALMRALTTWNETGVPNNPAAWLAKVALRSWIDQSRRRKRVTTYDPMVNELTIVSELPTDQGDERIKLMMGLAHPAIDSSLHAPLMLQIVLGIDATRIGDAFLVAPSTMAQRLVRAKDKIRRSGIPFDCDGDANRSDRLHSMMEAVYTSFTSSYQVYDASDIEAKAIVGEAIELARILVRSFPEEPEAMGLLALMLFVNSRRHATHDSRGKFIPLDQQDMTLWDRNQINEANQLLWEAQKRRSIGCYQLEAAIQSAQADRLRTGTIDWRAVYNLYQALVQIHPGLGAKVAKCVVKARFTSPAEAIEELQSLPSELSNRYQPYWIALFHLASQSGDRTLAAFAREQAIALTTDATLIEYLHSLD